MSTKDDILKAVTAIFKAPSFDDLTDDIGPYEYEAGDDDGWDHDWTGPNVTNTVMAREGEDGWTVRAGNGQELFVEDVLEGVTEEEAAAAVDHITSEWQGTSPMQDGYIMQETFDEMEEGMRDAAASAGVESATATSDESDGESGGMGDPEAGDPEPTTVTDSQESTESEAGPAEGSDASDGDSAAAPDDEGDTSSESAAAPSGGADGADGDEGGDAPSPWVEYRGNAGGEGWQNVITGEIRYQKERPAPTQEEQDAMADQQAVVDDEGQFSEGDYVVLPDNIGGDDIHGQIVGQDENGAVVVEDEDGGQYATDPSDLHPDPEAAARQEPDDGYADGWAEPPDDYTSIEIGDHVEVYNPETGEWAVGRKVDGGMSDYMQVDLDGGELEGGDTIEVLASGETDWVLTAAEEGVSGIPFTDEDFKEVEAGQDILFDSPAAEGYTETNVVTSFDDFSGTIKIEDIDGEFLNVHIEEADMLAYDPPEWRNWAFEDLSILERFEGEYVKYQHPSRGVVAGPLNVQEDDEGDLWYHIEDDDNGDGMNCSGFTSKQGHPLGPDNVDMLEFDDPFDQWLPKDAKNLVPGDTIVVDGDTHTVENVDYDIDVVEVESEDGAFFAMDHEGMEEFDVPVIDEAWTHDVEPPDPPEMAPEGWEEPYTIEDADTVDYYDNGDYIWFVNEDGDAEVAEVMDTDTYGDVLYQQEGGTVETVPKERIQARADSGLPDHAVDLDATDLHVGAAIEYQYMMSTGQVDDYTAVITDINGDNIEANIIEGDKEGKVFIDPDAEEFRITGYDSDYSPYDEMAYNGMEMSGDEIADTILDDLGFNYLESEDKAPQGGPRRLSKQAWWDAIEKSQQNHLKGHMKEFFPETEVENFYSAIQNWKGESHPDKSYHYDGPEADPNKRIASALALVMGVEAPVRGTTDGEPIPYSEEELGEWYKMAEASVELSQRFFIENQLDGDHDGIVTDIARGGSGASFRTFMDSFLEEPDAGKYTVKTSAFNNYTGHQDETSNTWKQWSFAPEISAGHVGLMTDYMFNPEQKHQGENELWVAGDNLHVDPGSVALGEYPSDGGRKHVFENGIEGMEYADAVSVASFLDEYWHKMRGNVGHGLVVDDDWSEAQVKTLNRLVDQFEQHGISKGSLNDKIRNEAGAFGLQPDDWRVDTDYSEDDVSTESDWTLSDFENAEVSTEDGIPVSFWNEYENEKMDGDIIGVYDDQLLVWDDYGTEHEVDPSDLRFVDEVELSNAQPDPSVESMGETDGWESFDSSAGPDLTSALSPGDWINIDPDIHGDTATVQVDHVEGGTVYPVEDSFTGPSVADPYYSHHEIADYMTEGTGDPAGPDATDEGDDDGEVIPLGAGEGGVGDSVILNDNIPESMEADIGMMGTIMEINPEDEEVLVEREDGEEYWYHASELNS